MIDLALATGMPVTVSPNFSAEHMGMPCHQADIREQEAPKAEHHNSGLMALSSGSRSFTRYGYADLMREDRHFDILWRVWPGTQRLLVWADPVFAGAYARAFQFCGSSGVKSWNRCPLKDDAGRATQLLEQRDLAPMPTDRCARAGIGNNIWRAIVFGAGSFTSPTTTWRLNQRLPPQAAFCRLSLRLICLQPRTITIGRRFTPINL